MITVQRKTILFTLFLLLQLLNLRAQLTVQPVCYSIDYSDYSICTETYVSFTWPLFFSSDGSAVRFINDSINQTIPDTAGYSSEAALADSTNAEPERDSPEEECSWTTLTNYSNFTILLNSGSLLSFETTSSVVYNGMGHGREWYATAGCCDLQNRKWLKQADIFIPGKYERIRRICDSAYIQQGGYESDLGSMDSTCFGVDSSGVVFYFTENAGSSYADPVTIHVPVRTLSKYLRPRYRKMIKSALKASGKQRRS